MKIKICGLKEAEHAKVAIEAGANFLGCVFFEPSPRNVTFRQANAVFSQTKGTNVKRVGLFVNPTNEFLEKVLTFVDLDIIQLHGHETVMRAHAIKCVFDKEVIKALPIADEGDVEKAKEYDEVVDYLLFDAKPPTGAAHPGGNALAFDWSLLKGSSWETPWLLAGGLSAENIGDALTMVDPFGVDVSSGVEVKKGLKSVEMIQTFIKSVKKSSNG